MKLSNTKVLQEVADSKSSDQQIIVFCWKNRDFENEA